MTDGAVARLGNRPVEGARVVFLIDHGAGSCLGLEIEETPVVDA